MNINNLEELNQKACKLTTEQIKNLTEDEILSMAMERPGHPGAFGFMLGLPYFKSSGHLAKTTYALMKRLMKVDNLKEKMVNKGNAGKKVAQFGGTNFVFIPQSLVVKSRPELENFPLNIVFSSFTFKDGKQVTGDALYDPDLSTFKQEKNIQSMEYKNKYGGNSLLRINYKIKEGSWSGEKFINGKSILIAYGKDWKSFFVHLTMNGLTKGESCSYSDMPTTNVSNKTLIN